MRCLARLAEELGQQEMQAELVRNLQVRTRSRFGTRAGKLGCLPNASGWATGADGLALLSCVWKI